MAIASRSRAVGDTPACNAKLQSWRPQSAIAIGRPGRRSEVRRACAWLVCGCAWADAGVVFEPWGLRLRLRLRLHLGVDVKGQTSSRDDRLLQFASRGGHTTMLTYKLALNANIAGCSKHTAYVSPNGYLVRLLSAGGSICLIPSRALADC